MYPQSSEFAHPVVGSLVGSAVGSLVGAAVGSAVGAADGGRFEMRYSHAMGAMLGMITWSTPG